MIIQFYLFFEELDLKGLKNIKILRSDIINKDISYNINDTKKIIYKGDNRNIILKIINKFEFNQINSIELTESNLNDDNVKLLGNLFTENLENINLSNNNISDLSKFTNSNLKGLISLDLSNNKISDIECLGNETNFNKLEKINLSNNNIKMIKKVNIKSLKHLDLLNNEINEGIKEFMENNKIYSDSLNLTFNDNSVLFKFENQLNVEFKYKLTEGNYDKFFDFLMN